MKKYCCRILRLVLILSLCYAQNAGGVSVSSLILIEGNFTNFHIEENIEDTNLLKRLSNENPDVYHLFSHGRSGQLYIQGKWRNASEIADFILSRIESQFLKIRHINIYGCEFAKGSKGEEAINYLNKKLNISISASDDITGQGGDWLLEIGVPTIVKGLEGYRHKMQCPTITVTDPDIDGDGVANSADVDDDNDGIHDVVERGVFNYINITDLIVEKFIPNSTNNTLTNLDVSSRLGLPSGSVILNGEEIHLGDNTIRVEPNDNNSRYTLSGSHPVFAKLIHGSTIQADSKDGVRAIDGNVYKLTSALDVGFVERKNVDPNGDTLYEVRNTTLSGMNNSVDFSWESRGVVTAFGFYTTNTAPVNAYRIELAVFRDTDKDSIPDYQDLDSDNDGIPDAIEACGNREIDLVDCRVPYSSGSDSDGPDQGACLDGKPTVICESPINSDSFLDTIPDYLDLDSDDDNCFDSNEGSTGSTTSQDSYVSGPTNSNGLIIDSSSTVCARPPNEFWKLSHASTACDALPIKLISFSIDALEHGVVLDWEVTGMEGGEMFRVEYSLDGANFTMLSTMPSYNDRYFYNYLHKEISALQVRKLYYRLGITSPDGQSSYSPTRFVDLGVNQEKALSVYPFPANIGDDIVIKGKLVEGKYQLYGLDGRLVFEGKIVENGLLEIAQDKITHPGLYVIHFRNGHSARCLVIE